MREKEFVRNILNKVKQLPMYFVESDHFHYIVGVKKIVFFILMILTLIVFITLRKILNLIKFQINKLNHLIWMVENLLNKF